MSLFASKWLAHAVLITVRKHLDDQATKVRNVWRDQSDPEIRAAVRAAWDRVTEARHAVNDAIDIIKEASK